MNGREKHPPAQDFLGIALQLGQLQPFDVLTDMKDEGLPEGEGKIGKSETGEKISSPFGPLSVRKDTMWEARLVLSTLDPSGPWAGPLRAAIRTGNRAEVDRLLASIYAERSGDSGARHPDGPAPLSSRPVAKCTVLPPSPSKRGRISA